MFWKKQNTVVANVVEEDLVPVEVVAGEVDVEYEKLAKNIGWSPEALVNERLRKFMAENGITAYTYYKVQSYLDKKFPKISEFKPGWVWRPLRKSDRGMNINDVLGTRARGNGSLEEFPTYYKAIPLAVLQTIEKISEAIPEVHFFVSDTPTPNADPFLMVAVGITGVWVIERWDEPSFRG